MSRLQVCLFVGIRPQWRCQLLSGRWVGRTCSYVCVLYTQFNFIEIESIFDSAEREYTCGYVSLTCRGSDATVRPDRLYKLINIYAMISR